MLITYLVLLVQFRPPGSDINSIVNFTLAQFIGNMSDHLQNWKPGTPHILACGPFHCCGLTLITAWISNYIHYEMWDEITYPPPNFQHCSRAAIEGWEWISNFIHTLLGIATQIQTVQKRLIMNIAQILNSTFESGLTIWYQTCQHFGQLWNWG